MLFKDVVAKYTSDKNPEWVRLAPRSKQIYLNGLRYLTKFDNIEVDKITRPMVIDHRDDMYEMSGMCRVSLTCLSNTLRYAHDRGWVEYNQALNIKGLPKAKGILRWSNEQIDLFLDTAPDRLRYAVMLALYTGQRRSDLVRMKWDDYDGDFIKVKQQKTGKYLEVPAHLRLIEMLDTMPRVKNRGGYILTNSRGDKWAPDTLRRAVRDHLVSIGITNLSIHGLRKSAASILAEAGCTSHQIQAITGHSLQELANYTRQADQKKLAKEAMAAWK